MDKNQAFWAKVSPITSAIQQSLFACHGKMDPHHQLFFPLLSVLFFLCYLHIINSIKMASKKRHMIRGGTDQEDASNLKLGEGNITWEACWYIQQILIIVMIT